MFIQKMFKQAYTSVGSVYVCKKSNFIKFVILTNMQLLYTKFKLNIFDIQMT